MSLRDVRLRPGDPVRFRRHERQGWQDATVVGREADGSIRLRDAEGRARAIPPERIEVRATGRRGGHSWEPLTDRMARSEQLDLFADS